MNSRSAPFIMAVGITGTILAAQQRPAFRSETAGVRLDVAVLEGTNPVRGLTANDFDVADEKIRQQVAVTETHNAHLDIAIVRPPLPSFTTERRMLVQNVIEGVRDSLGAEDRLGLVIASAAPLVVRSLTPYTHDMSLPFEAASGAALRDSIVQALALFDLEDRRKAVIVITDGRHDESWMVPTAVLATVDRSQAQLVIAAIDADSTDGWDTMWNDRGVTREAVTQFQGPTSLTSPRWLLESMHRSGGFRVNVGDATSLDRVREALLQLRSEYVITYTPADIPGWHDVKVSVRRKKVSVIVRAGYWR
jgi:hypothetical protein